MRQQSRAVTLRDLARALDLSITTISRALAGYGDVSEATRRRVLQAAEELGYMPDVTAQRLQKGRTDTIGFVIPTSGPRFSDPFFSEMLAGIGNEATRHDFDLLVSTRSPDTPEEEAAYRRLVDGRLVDGLLVIRTRVQDWRIAYLAQIGFPFVTFGRSDTDADFPYVDEDGFLGMQLMTQHLLDSGHSRLAAITAPPGLMFNSHRLAGIKAVAQEDESLLMPDNILTGNLTQEGGYKAMDRLLSLSPPPTAVLAFNDLMALGAISAAQKRGVVVGQDVSITGFDDIPLAEYTHPRLTTVRQPIYEIGRRICNMLIHLIQGKELAERHVVLQPKLVVRESCGAGSRIAVPSARGERR